MPKAEHKCKPFLIMLYVLVGTGQIEGLELGVVNQYVIVDY